MKMNEDEFLNLKLYASYIEFLDLIVWKFYEVEETVVDSNLNDILINYLSLNL